jgi:prepilin-type N-terminal cleavage/methylation domain-containing protein
MRDKRDLRKPGFTLIELGVVMAIIGILISLILVAGADGIRRAEERQTQALVIKLETALIDRVDALMDTSGPINQTHRYLAAITYADPTNNANHDPITASIDRRAQVIAQFDYMKAELPDVFYLNSVDTQYPFIFAMPPYPITATGRDAFALPLGNRQPGLPYTTTTAGSSTPTYAPTPGFDVITGYNDLGVSAANLPALLVVTPDTGIYGASFTAMGALTKNLYQSAANALGANAGIIPKQGYDGTDNDKDGYIDNISEVTSSPSGPSASASAFQAQVSAQLTKHDHKTARSEMLYALLVEGQGPLGSAFNASDFTNRDVADTDGDGMPEFIDAWGQPLQFYRWPIFYGIQTATTASASDSQQGFQPYLPTQRRQLDPLDPNQLLTSVAWWGPTNTTFASMLSPATVPNFTTGYSGSPASPQANAFMTYFHIIIDPLTTGNNGAQMWDRTNLFRRRAYYSKFLVLSGGPDKEIGVFRLNKDYLDDIDSSLSPAVAFPTGNPVTDAQLVNWCESQAAQVEFTGRTGVFHEQVAPVLTTPTSLYLQQNSGLDDISNHALSAPGTGAH